MPGKSASGVRVTALKSQPAVRHRQTVLAVARNCRDCGMRLGPLEAAMHECTSTVEWRCKLSQSVAVSWTAAGRTDASNCRIVRLGGELLASCAASSAARTQLDSLWGMVERDLSHSLGSPSCADIAAGRSVVLLGLRGRAVVGVVWAEWVPSTASLHGMSSPDEDVDLDSAATRVVGATVAEPYLGVALVWVRRSEQRKGLATALVEAARKSAAGCPLLGSAGPAVPLERLAFSQPTNEGFAFASRFLRTAHHGRVLVYQPEWATSQPRRRLMNDV